MKKPKSFQRGLPGFLLISLCCANLSQAQSNDTTLDEVVISASRIPTTFNKSDRTVDVIDSAEIARAPVQSVAELLDYYAGVDVRSRGPRGVQADVSLRGSNYEQVLIMVDGIKMSDPQTGHHNLDLPVSLDDIQSIEILKGSGARAYGQNAFSGAINIITRKPQNSRIKAGAAYGEHNYKAADLGLTHVQDKFSQTVSGSYGASDGYRYNTDFTNYNVAYTAQANMGDNSISLDAGFMQKDFGANSFYSEKFPDQWEKTKTLFLSTAMKMGKKNSFTPRFYWRRHYDQFRLKRFDPAFYQNLHTTDVGGAEFNYLVHSKAGTTAIGGDIRNESIQSSNLGVRERQNAGLALEHRLTLFNKLSLSPGVYLNWTNAAGFQAYPGIDAGYALGTHSRVYASAAKSFRLPTFTDMYYTSPTDRGNAELKPEQAWTYELGYKYGSRYFMGRTAIFSRDGRQLIDWVKNGELWYAQNISRVQTNGAEVQFAVYPPRKYKHLPIQKVDLQYAYLDSKATLAPEQSRYALDQLKHQLIVGLDLSIIKNLGTSWKLRYEDRVIYDPYLLLDGRVYYRFKGLTAYVQGTNLLNENYYEVGRIPMPGRWITGGLDVQLNLK